MENNFLVTIVVPMYNVEKYIEKCLDSLINQTYKNIEILVINDGSKDNSLIIAERKAKEDNRIKIISQLNQGLSAARNTGMDNAKGQYICFVDSDDFVHPDYVKLLLESMVDNDSDISVCDFFYIDEEDNTWKRKEKENKIYNNIEALKDIFCKEQNTEVMTWNKLYKIELFKDNNIYFPVGRYHEDNFTTYKLYYYSKKIAMISDELYYYLQRNNSIMGQKFNKKRLDILDAIDETKKFFKDKKIKLDEEIQCCEIITKINILNNMIRDKFKEKERITIIDDIKKHKKTYKNNKYIDRKTKIALTLLFGNGDIYEFSIIMFNFLKRAIKRGK